MRFSIVLFVYPYPMDFTIYYIPNSERTKKAIVVIVKDDQNVMLDDDESQSGGASSIFTNFTGPRSRVSTKMSITFSYASSRSLGVRFLSYCGVVVGDRVGAQSWWAFSLLLNVYCSKAQSSAVNSQQ